MIEVTHEKACVMVGDFAGPELRLWKQGTPAILSNDDSEESRLYDLVRDLVGGLQRGEMTIVPKGAI